MTRRPSRRAILLGGLGVGAAGVAAAAVGVEEGVLPGRPLVQETLGLNGEPGRVPDVAPGRVVQGSFVSQARGGVRTGWSIAYPPGSPAELPVLVVLHGLGNDHRSAMSPHLGLDRFLAAGVKAGLPPFAIASVDGGRTYWHRRPDGEDAGAMVLEELIPLLQARGLDTTRVGLLGWSMGGYAALRLGAVLGAKACACVVAESPAQWTDGESASASGFRDADEYAEFSVFGHQEQLAGIPVRIDCGTGDPFYRATKEYVDGFPRDDRPAAHFQPGAHDMAYWRRMAPAQLRFVARHLT
ncbi:MAG: alpha/beta hydrolase-fold protein [Jiangellaceae bacterium]